jgi:hypothetical protein
MEKCFHNFNYKTENLSSTIPLDASSTHPTLVHLDQTTRNPNISENLELSSLTSTTLSHGNISELTTYAPYLATIIPTLVPMKNTGDEILNELKQALKFTMHKKHREHMHAKDLRLQEKPIQISKSQTGSRKIVYYVPQKKEYQIFDPSAIVPIGRVKKLKKARPISDREV